MKSISVDYEKFIEIVEESGLPVEVQKSFTKVIGTRSRRLYISNAEKVTRVELSGFTIEGKGFTEVENPKLPRVKQTLDFNLLEGDVLNAFRKALEGLTADEDLRNRSHVGHIVSNGVARRKLMEIVESHGLRSVEQGAFTKVIGPLNRYLYIANTQRVCRVYLYNFRIEGPGFVPKRENQKTGPKVELELDFSLAEDEVLHAFRKAVEYLARKK